jgi:hypothetical protein
MGLSAVLEKRGCVMTEEEEGERVGFYTLEAGTGEGDVLHQCVLS